MIRFWRVERKERSAVGKRVIKKDLAFMFCLYVINTFYI